MGKYMAKGFLNGEVQDAGFKRRWSRSRGWPSGGQLELAVSSLGVGHWDQIVFTKGRVPPIIREIQEVAEGRYGQHPLEKRVGTDLAVELGYRQADRSAAKVLEKIYETAHEEARPGIVGRG